MNQVLCMLVMMYKIERLVLKLIEYCINPVRVTNSDRANYRFERKITKSQFFYEKVGILKYRDQSILSKLCLRPLRL